MKRATRNQISNVNNPYQGNAKKVLCVCSAGALRSPTLANILHVELGYNTRAVGTAQEYCIIPISEVLVAWADEIVFVDDDCKVYLDKEDWELIEEWGAKVVTLGVEDKYDYGNPELKDILLQQYLASV